LDENVSCRLDQKNVNQAANQGSPEDEPRPEGFDSTGNLWRSARGLKTGHVIISSLFAPPGTVPSKSFICHLARAAKSFEPIRAHGLPMLRFAPNSNFRWGLLPAIILQLRNRFNSRFEFKGCSGLAYPDVPGLGRNVAARPRQITPVIKIMCWHSAGAPLWRQRLFGAGEPALPFRSYAGA